MSIKSFILLKTKYQQERIILKIIQKNINTRISKIAKRNIEKTLGTSYLNMQTITNMRFDKLVQYESEIIKCSGKKLGTDIAIVTIMSLAILQIIQ